MSEPTNARIALVTGAGSGIGRATAERLAHAGYRVIGTVRDPERARILTDAARPAHDGRLRFVPLEITSAAQVATLAASLAADGGIDLLVQNAGYGVFGAIEEVDGAAVERQFAVNVLGPLDLLRHLLPGLRQRKGQVIWIGSLAGRISLPFQAHYSATKFAVAAISDALRMELKPHGVRVSCVEPGDFATDFTVSRSVRDAASSPYRASHEACLAAVEKQEREAPSPEWVANLVERLSRAANPPARVPVGENARLLCLLLRVLPDWLREIIVRKTYAQ